MNIFSIEQNSFTAMMEAACFSETLVIFYQTKRRNVLGKQCCPLPLPQVYQTLQFWKFILWWT